MLLSLRRGLHFRASARSESRSRCSAGLISALQLVPNRAPAATLASFPRFRSFRILFPLQRWRHLQSHGPISAPLVVQALASFSGSPKLQGGARGRTNTQTTPGSRFSPSSWRCARSSNSRPQNWRGPQEGEQVHKRAPFMPCYVIHPLGIIALLDI